MSDSEAIRILEERVRSLEDKLAIFELVTSYGFAVDGGDAVRAGEMFGDDGVFDTNSGVRGRAEIEALAERYREVEVGFAHVVYPPMVKIDGDRATVICYSNTLNHRSSHDGWDVQMLSANRWDVERVDGRWRVRNRTNRLMDGSAESKAIAAEGVALEHG